MLRVCLLHLKVCYRSSPRYHLVGVRPLSVQSTDGQPFILGPDVDKKLYVNVNVHKVKCN